MRGNYAVDRWIYIPLSLCLLALGLYWSTEAWTGCASLLLLAGLPLAAWALWPFLRYRRKQS